MHLASIRITESVSFFKGFRFGNCWCKDNKKTRSKWKYAGKNTQDCNNLFIFVPENEK